MLPTEDLFVYVYVLIDDAIKARAIVIPARPGAGARLLRRGDPGDHPGARAAGPPQRGRVPRRGGPRLGAPVPGTAATKASSTGGPAGCGARSSSSARRWRPACPKTTASRSTPARCRSSTPPGSAAPTAGPAPMACMPGSAATPRTPSGSTASAWRPRPTWAAASCGPGASCPPPSASVTWAPTCWKPGRRPATCSRTRGSTARRSPRPRPPAAPPCWSRPPGTSARPCRRSAEGHRPVAQPHRDHLQGDNTRTRWRLARHGAHTFWGLLARTAATIAAHTLMRACLAAP